MSFLFVFPMAAESTALMVIIMVTALMIFLISRKVFWLEPFAILTLAAWFYYLVAYGLYNWGHPGMESAVGVMGGHAIFATMAFFLSSYVTLRKAVTGR